MNAPIHILVGTSTGNAQFVAEESQFLLAAAGHATRILPMDDLDASVFTPAAVFLVCISTYGYGDVPANAKRLYESLVRDRPSLTGVRYGLVSLGDTSHAQTYGFGGRRFDQILTKLGATRLGEILVHDASSGVMPEEAAAAWMPDFLATLETAAAR